MGKYYIVAPQSLPEKIWVFFHGWNGSPNQYIGKQSIEAVIEEEKVLLVLPEGLSKTWSIQNMGGEDSYRNEEAFLKEILFDLGKVDSIENIPLFLGGFSLGGSLSEDLACHSDIIINGVYPISGGFWDPVPSACQNTGFAVRHIHGRNDGTWPYEGRRVGSGTQAHQEDVQALWKQEFMCSDEIIEEQQGPLNCWSWSGCRYPLSWCLHDEGHTRISGWFSRMMSFSLF